MFEAFIEWFNANTMNKVIYIGGNLTLYIVLGKLLFGSWGGLFLAFFFWIKPDALSAMHGELQDDWNAEMSLNFFLVVCVIFTLSFTVWFNRQLDKTTVESVKQTFLQIDDPRNLPDAFHREIQKS